MTVTEAPTDAGPATTELAVTGMTCGACVSRIERRLAKLGGVEAQVNLTTGRARVTHTCDVELLVATVEKLGFGASVVRGATTSSAAVSSEGPLRSVEPAAGAPRPREGDAVDPIDGALRSIDATEGALRSERDGAGTAAGEGEPDDPEVSDLRRRALVCLALSVPVIAVAMNYAWQFRYWQWFSLVLAAPVVFWGGWRFHRAAAKHLRHGSLTMDTLVSVGVLAAFGWSVGTLFLGDAGLGGVRHRISIIPGPDPFGGTRTIYLETAVAIVTSVLIGRWIELRGRRQALRDSGVGAVGGSTATPDATLLVGERALRVPVENVRLGDHVAVLAGETVPVDGVVDHGGATLDVAAMTGESVPVDAVPGTRVLAGTVVVTGRVAVRATGIGEDTQWARLTRRVADAQLGKASVQRLADSIAGRFVPVVLVLALYTFGFWWFADADPAFAVAATMAVLVVACPCALGLATPTALAVAAGRGRQLGILLRGPQVLETTRRIDTVVLDKTGTVTTGRMALRAAVPAAGVDLDVVWRRVAALERDVDHPVARALVEAAAAHQGARATDVEVLDGLGVRGTVDGTPAMIGRRSLVAPGTGDLDALPADLDAVFADAEASGSTAVVLAWADTPDGALRPRAVLVVGDTVRPSAAAAVARMRSMKLRPMLLTGDNAAAAHAVAREVGIDPDDVVAGVLPTDKADEIDRLRAQGRVVAMVGDGVNDAAALARADLGLAMGTGSALAVDAGDLTLVGDDLRSVTDALRLARRTLATIRGNLFWAFAYNVAALPLAVFGLLNPMIAGAAMGLSSLFVVGNSLRIRYFAGEQKVGS